jgi:hypothetical protein
MLTLPISPSSVSVVEPDRSTNRCGVFSMVAMAFLLAAFSFYRLLNVTSPQSRNNRFRPGYRGVLVQGF